MRRSSGPRKTANLSESIHRQFSMYAFAASAAGVGALCLTQAAEAKIVYTPANVRIVPNAGLVRIDLNHGIADFGLSNTFKILSSETFAALKVKKLRPVNEVWEVFSTYKSIKFVCAAALPRGAKVGPKGQFMTVPNYGAAMAVNDLEYVFGPWLHVKQAYLGLKFVINGKTHFGWARVKVTATEFRPITATLSGYAYETIPNKLIIAGATKGPDDNGVEEPEAALSIPTPEPVTLGALALGAPGLSIWRRKESADALS
jgi:hypothetical protein